MLTILMPLLIILNLLPPAKKLISTCFGYICQWINSLCVGRFFLLPTLPTLPILPTLQMLPMLPTLPMLPMLLTPALPTYLCLTSTGRRSGEGGEEGQHHPGEQKQGSLKIKKGQAQTCNLMEYDCLL